MKEALKLALEALEFVNQTGDTQVFDMYYADKAITAIKEALMFLQDGAQPEQEPAAWMDANGNISDNNDHKCFPIPLYTTPPQRKPLTDEEIKAVIARIDPDEQYMPKALRQFVRAIEAKLKEKNT